MKKISIFISALCIISGFSSCSDFFNQESDHVIYAENHKLDSDADTIYGLTGILKKLQALGDRTIILGEVRGDLCNVTNTANSDLRDIAHFNVSAENKYNSPRDYYAVINNCNFFIENVDTALKNNRNEYIFMREYAAVKAIRAWTYLQLVINYGKVPFVDKPILTKEQSEANYPQYGITEICEYFINDLIPLAERYGREFPRYGSIGGNNSQLFYFPINIVLGDLYLWHGSVTKNKDSFKQSALRYYKYISERNGNNSFYNTGIDRAYWPKGDATWVRPNTREYQEVFNSENYNENSELITLIPSSSLKTEGDYSEVYGFFQSIYDNNYHTSIVPSKRIEEISEAQQYCLLSVNGLSVTYAPTGLTNHQSGDLRLSSIWEEDEAFDPISGNRIETSSIMKYTSRNIHIYRRQMVFLRMAEALNQAGYPRMAFQILSNGLNNNVIKEQVYPYVNESDSIFISQFDLSPTRYYIYGWEEWMGQVTRSAREYSQGMHSRGSGYTPMNEYYQLPIDTLKTEAEQLPDLQAYVEDKILTEEALEFAFEGIRFYDLMRFALRAPNPGQFMADKVYARRGEANKEAVRGEIKADLTIPENWYLKWNGKIGF